MSIKYDSKVTKSDIICGRGVVYIPAITIGYTLNDEDKIPLTSSIMYEELNGKTKEEVIHMIDKEQQSVHKIMEHVIMYKPEKIAEALDIK